MQPSVARDHTFCRSGDATRHRFAAGPAVTHIADFLTPLRSVNPQAQPKPTEEYRMSAVDTTNVIDTNGVKVESGMIPAMVRLVVAVGFGAFIILFVILPLGLEFGAGSLRLPDPALGGAARFGTGAPWPRLLLEGAMLTGAASTATWGLFRVLRKLTPVLDANALAQAHFLDTLDPRSVDLAVAFSAALSLFLELALIRWQSSVLEFLAFYKNFSLLACFAGLGLGYALAARTRVPLLMVTGSKIAIAASR
jgi:hypothetical protein